MRWRIVGFDVSVRNIGVLVDDAGKVILERKVPPSRPISSLSDLARRELWPDRDRGGPLSQLAVTALTGGELPVICVRRGT